MARRLFRVDRFGALLVTVFLLALLSFAYIGFFTRYMADDYCQAAAAREQGFVNFQISHYKGWTGRFSYSFAVSAAALIGPAIVPFLPFITLLCWLVVSVWAVYQVALINLWPRPLLTSLILAELIVFATLNTTHNIVQSFYWQAGMLNYIPEIILLTLYVGIICYRLRRQSQDRPSPLLLIGSALLMLFAGGFSEAAMFLQTGGLLLAAAACYKYAPDRIRRAILPLLIAGLAGSLVAMCIVVAAPGNSVRRSFLPASPDLITLAKLSLYYTAGFIAYTIYLSPLTTALLVLLPALSGYYLYHLDSNRSPTLSLKKLVWLLVLLPLIGFTLILICSAVSVYSISAFLPERSRVVPQFVVVCVAVCWGYFAGIALSKMRNARRNDASYPLTIGSVAVVALLALSPISAAWRTLSLAPQAKAGAFIWDQTDREIRAAKEQGIEDVTVPAVDDVESRLGAPRTELHVERDREHWKNRCMARYYGVKSIKAQ
jgi:Family of unknown function (DUF6056)